MVLRKEDLDNLVTNILDTGFDTGETKEFINSNIELETTYDELHKCYGISDAFKNEFIPAVMEYKSIKVGPYNSIAYLSMLPKLKEAFISFRIQGNKTRQCVIHFDEKHCFQSIQFLVRNNKLHIICTMRSCNAVDNLINDIFICSWLGKYFRALYNQAGLSREILGTSQKIYMNIGSLHVFK